MYLWLGMTAAALLIALLWAAGLCPLSFVHAKVDLDLFKFKYLSCLRRNVEVKYTNKYN